jgi:outer membrane protein assembly factor BamB
MRTFSANSRPDGRTARSAERRLCSGLRRLSAVTVGVLAALSLATLGLISPRAAHADEATVSVDTLRTGWDAAEPDLSPSAVTASDFGKLFTAHLDGQIYAQPVVAHGIVVAATENNNVYGLNAVNGSRLWTRNVGPAWPASTVGCGDLVPNVGVTSTPVYDASTNSVYLTAKVNDGPDAAHPHWYLHAVNADTGVERPGWPVTIAGSPQNDPAHPFNAERGMQRPGLLLMGGTVYAAFASHCDFGPYVGYVVGVSTTSHAVSSMWSTEAGSSYAEAGIWQSGGGLVSDSPGNIYLTTGNGVSPPPGPGNAPPTTLAESVVHLRVSADGSMHAVDYFSPANNAGLDQDDADLGSGGPTAIPTGFGTASHPHLLVQVGKDGRVFLLDRDNLGGMGQGPGNTDKVLSVAGPYNGVWGHSAFYGGAGGYVYNVGSNGYLRAFKLGNDGAGNPALAAVGTSSGTFGFSSGSPVVTSTGTTPGSALVWVQYVSGGNGAGAELRAYDAIPSNGVLKLRYSAPIGVGAKFVVAATDQGRVYVGTRDGQLIGFGHPTSSPVTSGTTDLGSTPVGTAKAGTVTVTAAHTLTISGATTAAPFAIDASQLPVTLAAGGSYALPVSMSPTGWGPQTGVLTLATSIGAATLSLTGTATQPGLAATPAALDFGVVPTGAMKTLTANIVNTGTAPVTFVGGGATPSAPFSTAIMPAAGAVLAPGASVAVSVTYRPTTATSDTGGFTSTSDAGSVTVPLSGTGVAGQALLTRTPAVVDLGTVPIGLSSTSSFDVANTGNVGLSITKAAPPAAPFGSLVPLAEGQQLAPEAVIHQSVSFTPTAAGPFTGSYLITSDDGRGPQNVTVRGVGVFDPIAVKASQIGRLLADPLTPEFAVPGGSEQQFRYGAIYWSALSGAHVVQGDIYALYQQLGQSGGLLGFPTSDELPIGSGRYSTFQFGRVYWSPTTGAHEVHGAILTEYLFMGGPTGALGFPTTNETVTPDRIGRYNHFAIGSIYWTPGTGAHEVQGAIRAAWASGGWELGRLGYPTTDEFAIAGGRRSNFQHGYITYLWGGRAIVH